MAILNFAVDEVGQVGVVPRVIKIQSTNNLSEISATNYLKEFSKTSGIEFSNTDLIIISYLDEVAGSEIAFMRPVISSGNITLTAVAGGEVILPVVSGNLPKFNGENGAISDSGKSANHIILGDGALTAGRLVKVKEDGVIEESSNVDAKLFQCSFDNPDLQGNIFRVDTEVTHSDLASAGTKVLFSQGGGEKQYKVLDIMIPSGSTNFSGGGGDRSIQIKNGADAVYTTMDSTFVQALDNARWGGTDLPFGADPITATTATNILAAYTGGTNDYTAGSVVISIIMQRVA